jgi:Arc/MetJ-type ribon-helix-helix transcriptional regulator
MLKVALYTPLAGTYMQKIKVKITITLNDQLISRLEELADRKYTTRSAIIRAAMAEYLDKLENAPTDTNHIIYADILKENPYVNPADTELLEFIRSQKDEK